MPTLLLSLLAPAHASSLDLIEVGGMWGTPGATNPSAVWWNPAGIAAGKGTQFLVEGAPTFAGVEYTRADPGYTDLPGYAPSPPQGYGGVDAYKFFGVIPYLGVTSDFGVEPLGVGVAVGVPFARGAHEVEDPGPGAFHLREGGLRALYLMAGAGWTFSEVFSIGLTGAIVQSQWDAVTDVVAITDVNKAAAENGFDNAYCEDNQAGPCDDMATEHPEYKTTLDFDKLQTGGFTFGGGVHVTPTDTVAISVAYQHGIRLDHSGDLRFTAVCPPAADAIGTIAADLAGLCDTETGEGAVADGTGRIGYDLPGRIHGGIVVHPAEKLRLEAMGGFVFWNVFSDYEIETEFQADEFEDTKCGGEPCSEGDLEAIRETADLVTQERKWARDNQNSFWAGLDGKYRVSEALTLGGRVLFDKAAIPDSALSTNNFDADALGLGALAVISPVKQLGIGLSFNQQILMTREVTDSAFAVTMVENEAAEDRYFYPSANGTYKANISRIGISLRGRFLPKKDAAEQP